MMLSECILEHERKDFCIKFSGFYIGELFILKYVIVLIQIKNSI